MLADHCDLIDGARETFEWCQQRGIHVGSSTGYTRELMEVVKPLAAQAGYQPEIVLCAEDAPQGRPAPWLIYQCAQQWNVYPMGRIVKVDDTLVEIEAGRNAGCWTIGISRTGNLMGLSVAEWNDLEESEQQVRLDAVTDKFRQAGADFVVPGVAEVPEVIGQIESQAGGPGSFGGG